MKEVKQRRAGTIGMGYLEVQDVVANRAIARREERDATFQC